MCLVTAIREIVTGNCIEVLTVIETEPVLCVAHPGYRSLSLNYHLGKRAVLLSLNLHMRAINTTTYTLRTAVRAVIVSSTKRCFQVTATTII